MNTGRKDVHKQRHRKKAVRELYTSGQIGFLTTLLGGIDPSDPGKPGSLVRSLVGRGLITLTGRTPVLTDFGRQVAEELTRGDTR